MPEHYWGAKAIMARIGLRDHRRLPYWIRRHSLPAFDEYPFTPRNTYYSSEPLILAWESLKAKYCREELIRKQDEKPLSHRLPQWVRKQ